MDSLIKPYKVHVSDEKIASVKAKLDNATFPEDVPVYDDNEFGMRVKDVKRLAEYWRNGFDWRAQEAKINELPQFITKVPVSGFGDVELHFVHQKSKAKNALPLVFVHGCEF